MSVQMKTPPSKPVIELALVTVHASGDIQDEAAEIVSVAGGRLLSLDDLGFTAQVTNRPEAIDKMIGRLKTNVAVDVVRSGGLSPFGR